MQGTPDDRGVNYRALQELFLLKASMEGKAEFALSLSVLEVSFQALGGNSQHTCPSWSVGRAGGREVGGGGFDWVRVWVVCVVGAHWSCLYDDPSLCE
jgi:hypothetical protein